MAKDYYQILGVNKSSDTEEIKKAFRKLAHKYHPDKKEGDEAKFKEISEAYSILGDQKKRAEYDAYGRVFSEGGGGAGGFDFSGFQGGGFEGFEGFDFGDIFNEFFSGGRSRTKRGRDISIDLELSFKESVFGVERKVLLTKTSPCTICQGSGAEKDSPRDTCTTCNGNGKMHETKKSLLGTFTSVRECDACHGKGTIPKKPCKICRGQGLTRKEEEIVITVPAGIENGEMIRLSGSGEAIQGGDPGDLYVKVHVRPDPTFYKEGVNLVRTLNLKLSDALLGGKHTVTTLDGSITITIPEGVSHGEILRVRGRGIPLDGDRRGDLLIKIAITLPNKLSRKAKKLVEELKHEGI